MSSEILRRAASLMRERAEWCYAEGDLPEWYDAAEMGAILHRSEPEHSRIGHDATHIASWHPAVALAVADWLDLHTIWADRAESAKSPTVLAALTVARAYLGEAS